MGRLVKQCVETIKMVYLSFVDVDQSCHELVILWVTFGHNEIAQFHDCIHCIVVNRVNVNAYIPQLENTYLNIYIHFISQVEKDNKVDTSNSEQQRTYDADSLELQLDHGKRKNQYTKNKSSNKQTSSESGQDKIRYASNSFYI